MDCSRIERLWPRHFADTLEEAEARDLSEHLAACGHCRTRRDAIEKAFARFGELPRQEPPPRVWSEIEAKIEREMLRPPGALESDVPAPRARRSYGWLIPAWGLAAAVLILIVLVAYPSKPAPIRVVSAAGFVSAGGHDVTTGSTLLRENQTLETGAGSRAEIEFPDGIRAAVLERSSLDLLPSPKRRELRLTAGEAEFSADGPLRVETPAGTVMVERGRFAIGLANSVQADLRLLAGTAQIETPGGNATLAAGTWLALMRGSPLPAAAPLEAYEAFVRNRETARRAGERLGKVLAIAWKSTARTPEEAKALQEQYVDALSDYTRARRELEEKEGSRTLAALTEGLWESALELDPPKCAAFRDLLAETLEAGRREGLPGGWFLKETENLGSPPERAAALRLKGDFLERLNAQLPGALHARVKQLLDEEDDD